MSAGKVVFQTNRDGNTEVYTSASDGTNRVNLTQNPNADITPHVSRDGRRIVFASNRSGGFALYTMNADGSSPAVVPSTGSSDRWPSWIGDRQLLFHRGSFPFRDVYVVDADGANLRNLTPDAADSAWAAAAPHGPTIAFSRYTDAEGQRLYTLNTRDGTMSLVTPGSPDVSDAQASWAPRGNAIVFSRFGDTDIDLFYVRKDGSDLRQLTNTPDRQESQPSFSADGKKILFHACSNPGEDDQHCANYAMNVGGGGEVELSRTPHSPYVDTFEGSAIDPFWSVYTQGTGPSLAQANGRLEVTLPAGTAFGPGGYANASAFMGCRFPGDFDMQVDYTLLSGALPAGTNVGFDATEWTGSSYSGQHGLFVHNPGFGSPGISTNFPDPGVYQPPYNDFVTDTSLSGTLRLVRTTTAGTTTMTAYRMNAPMWSFTSLPYAAPTSQAANLNVFTNLTPFPTEVRVAYDNFRISSGAITCPYWDDSVPSSQPSST